MIDFRCGRWQDALANVGMVDAVICDPPYSARTHEGALSATGETGVSGYACWTEEDARAFVGYWTARCRGWLVIASGDRLGPSIRDAAETQGRYVFPLLPVLQHAPRLSGDGPGCYGHLLCVSRPREARFMSWGSLPGWYEAPREGSLVRGGKPLGLMRAIVRDYSRPGDLVCDPCAGGGTTLLAAAIEGRRAVGAEMDPATFAKAKARLDAGYTPDMFAG